MLEAIFIPKPFEEVNDSTMVSRWSQVYDRLMNLPYNILQQQILRFENNILQHHRETWPNLTGMVFYT